MLIARSAPRRLRPAASRDDGQVLPLVIVYAAIAATLIVVALDISLALLARRDLAALADGAALAASQAVDDARLYQEGLGAALPLTQGSVEQVVARYVAASGADPDGFRTRVAADGTVTVTVHRDVHLPFVAVLGAVGVAPAWRDGAVPVEVTAHARSPVDTAG